jgi:hypothetical protein
MCMHVIYFSSIIIATLPLNNSSNSYDIDFKFRFPCCVIRDDINKIRFHLHIF